MRTAVCLIALLIFVSPAAADPLTCSLAEYRQSPGLTAAVAGDVLDATWDGDAGQQVRLRLAVVGGVPTIQELAVRVRPIHQRSCGPRSRRAPQNARTMTSSSSNV